MWEYNHLEHARSHKYIKKVRAKNGKWRYIYDVKQLKDDLGFDEREAVRRQRRLVNEYGEARTELMDKYLDITPEDIKYDPKLKVKQEHMRAGVAAADARYLKAGEEYYTRLEDYHQTPLGKINAKVRGAQDFIERLFKNDNIWNDFKKPKRRK